MRSQLSRFLLHALITLALLALLIAGLSRRNDFEIAIGDVVLRSQRGARIELPADVAPRPGPRELPAEPARMPPATSLDDAAGDAPGEPGARAVRNVVLLIGDGMGIGTASTSSMVIAGADGGLSFESAPVTGLVRTACADRPATDSGAAATAMATGFKADLKAISILPGHRIARTLLEAAHDTGLASGVVTTTGLVDATPAAFVAHVENRNEYGTILEQMLASPIEVRIGGDWTGQRPGSDDESPYWALLDRAEELVPPGTTLVRSAEGLATAPSPLVALLPPRQPGSDSHGPDLAVSARRAFELLSADPDGFVLLVECEITDGTAHNNDIHGVIDGMRELDRAVAEILKLSAERNDTLVIVTADHDTGSPSLMYGTPYSDGSAKVRWTGHVHTAQWVPLFAFGPGSERFGRLMDNTEIGLEIARLLDIKGFPEIEEPGQGL